MGRSLSRRLRNVSRLEILQLRRLCGLDRRRKRLAVAPDSRPDSSPDLGLDPVAWGSDAVAFVNLPLPKGQIRR